jgi:hypothetical protein
MTTLQEKVEYIVSEDRSVTTADVAADIGNARAVVLVRPEGETVPTVTLMPAVRSLIGAFSWEVFASRSLPASSWGKLRSDDHIIERDGQERFLGRLAVERSAAASSGRGSDARYHDGTTLDFILAGVAAALPGASKINVRLTTLLPISLWHLSGKVSEALKGTHIFRYNGRDVRVQIQSVTVRREAEAAYAGLEGDTSGRILIVDIGGRTVNLALFNNGEYRAGATLELGVEAALDNLDKALIGRGGRALTLAERSELLSALVAGLPYGYIIGGEKDQIEQLARAQFDATAAALCQEMRAKVPVDAAQRIVLIGGGAYPAFFGAAVKRALTKAESTSMPELANAYACMGVKKGRKK